MHIIVSTPKALNTPENQARAQKRLGDQMRNLVGPKTLIAIDFVDSSKERVVATFFGAPATPCTVLGAACSALDRAFSTSHTRAQNIGSRYPPAVVLPRM